MITVNIDGLKETSAYLNALASGDLRFGIAKGLTSLASGIRDKVRQELPQRFTLRTQWWDRGPYAIKTEKATKQSLIATVYTTAPWMRLQEDGGIKQVAGHRLAMPMSGVKRTKRDLVRADQKPRRLQKAFFIKQKDGNVFLATRVGKGKRSQLRFMWLLERSARIPKRFHFADTAQMVVDRVGQMHIIEGIKYALETSKR